MAGYVACLQRFYFSIKSVIFHFVYDYSQVIVFPRQNGQRVVIKIKASTNMTNYIYILVNYFTGNASILVLNNMKIYRKLSF